MAKYLASEAGMEDALESMRIRGDYGCSNGVERNFRDAPLMLISAGANKLRQMIIAHQLVARNPV